MGFCYFSFLFFSSQVKVGYIQSLGRFEGCAQRSGVSPHKDLSDNFTPLREAGFDFCSQDPALLTPH